MLRRLSCFAAYGLLFTHVSAQSFDVHAKPFLKEFCYKCHGENNKTKGDLDLKEFSVANSLIKDRDVWLDVLEQVETEEMPTKEPLPTDEERANFVKWLKGELNSVDWSKVKYAGHVAMPLLTKREYNNTMRDLLGVDVQPGHILFADGEGHSGFTTDRSNLFISPAGMEKYIAAAEKALDAMVGGVKPISVKFEAEKMLSTGKSKALYQKLKGADVVRLTIGQTTIYESIEAPVDGYYTIELRGFSYNGDDGKALVRLNNEPAGFLTFPGNGLTTQKISVFISKGSHQLTVNKGIDARRIMKGKERTFLKEVDIDWVKVSGPLTLRGKAIYKMTPYAGMSEEDSANQVLNHFALRAFRKPVSAERVARYRYIFSKMRESGAGYTESLKQAMLAILISPRFLYRDELAPVESVDAEEYALDQFQIASRLSYFIWLSMPDKELFDLAKAGKLSDPEILRAQVSRMLADPKAREFTSAFLGQWLGFESLGKEMIPDSKVFPEFDKDLSDAMKAETIMTFEHLIKNDLPILHFLDSKATFLNERLAEHYGIRGVKGTKMKPVLLKDGNRGGLLGMASILTSTSSPTRTSPVLRGKWVMETLLGEHIPEAPADVPELDEKAGQKKKMTLREELEMHREKTDCARCHDKIDPIGFGLENFDGVGRFRTKEPSGKKIDSSGELDGFKFEGVDALKNWLIKHRKKEFTRTLSEKMLAFAIGRKIETFDESALLKITTALEKDDYKISTLIEEVVLSHPFLNKSINNDIKINE